MNNTAMTATEKLETIRNYANAILETLDSKPLDTPMPWMIQITPEEFDETIAVQCAKLAVEIVKVQIDRATIIDPN